MAGYTRVDTTNNIADGNVIAAADLDNEFDGVQAAFNASTGHTHGGAVGEGAPIVKLGPTNDVTISASLLAPKTTNTVDLGSGSLKYKDLYLAGNASIAGTLGVTGATTLSAALTYGGVTLSNAVTGTGNMVLSASPTLTGTLSGANASLSGTLGVTGVATLGAGAVLNTPASVTLTNATGLPIATGVSGLGTGVATALAVNVGTAGAPVINGGVLGTPSSGTVTNLTGTASININGTVGATTPNTGAFTTLTTSSTVTLNGATANGVAYADASKVLTTGSALTFDGTKFYTSGVFLQGDTNNYGGYAFQAGNQNGLAIRNAANSAVIAYFGGGGSSALSAAGNYAVVGGTDGVIFGRGVNEDMRLTSTGLGIGTSSPYDKLEVSNSASGGLGAVIVATNPAAAATGNAASIGFRTSSSFLAAGYYSARIAAVQGSGGITDISTVFYRYDGGTPSGVELMRLDSSGNLGLGVTPSAWADLKSFDITEWGSLFGYSNQTGVAGNAYYNAGWKYKAAASNLATRYEQNSLGTHSWHIAPSGTAGDAISFTQAMTLDASGNLLIGRTTGTNANLDVYESGSTDATVRVGNAQNAAVTSIGKQGASSYGATSAADGFLYSDGTLSIMSDNASGVIKFSAGGNTERARITSGGDLCVGTTSAVNSARETVSFQSSSGGTGISFIDAQANNTACFAAFYSNATQIGSITNNGNAAVLYNVTSDQRLKKNIIDAPEFGGLIDSIKVRSYDWIANETHQRAGFIAQELVTVAPEAVHQPADPEQMMAVDYSKLVPMLVKEIQSLRQRLAAAGI
jgi:hypothetical protein